MDAITTEAKAKADEWSRRIIGAAIEVHRTLGPGLLESAYEKCLAFELDQHGMQFRQQVPLPVEYKGARIECGYRIDLLVDDAVIVELKSVDQLAPVHEAQLLTYMKLARIRTGLLINFNQQRLIDGLRRFKL
jgi:GxxExxY protein